MSTAVRPGRRSAANGRGPAGTQPADVFVVFGITGDLARVMTFQALYRLERRGLLDCPIVGVAGDDWTVDQLREHARKCIADTGETIDDEIFDRFAARLSYVSGDFGDDATYEQVGSAIERCSEPRLLSRDPAVAVRDGDRGTGPGGRDAVGARGGREAVRARRGLGARAERRGPPAPGRVPALPDRPLPGLQGAGRDPIPPVREHDVRADLESQLHLVRAAHDGRELRCGRSRPFLRSRRRAARRGREPPDAGGGHHGDGAAGGQRPEHAGERDGLGLPGHARRRPGALRARSVRRLPRDRRRGFRLDDGDLRRSAAARRQLALVRRAVLHPHGQEPAGNRDRAAARVQAPAAARLPPRGHAAPGARPAHRAALPHHRDPAAGRSPARRCGEARAGQPRPGVRASRAARARRRTRCCCTRRWSATAGASSARTASRRPGGSCSRCSTPLPRSTRTRRGRGVRAPRTTSSPGTAAGTSRGCRHERDERDDAAERGRPLALPADRRLRVPLRLPHERARGPGRLDRLAVRAALRLAERVRLPARSPGRLVPARAVRDQRAHGPHLRAGDQRPRHHVEDAHRLGPRARRPDDGPRSTART